MDAKRPKQHYTTAAYSQRWNALREAGYDPVEVIRQGHQLCACYMDTKAGLIDVASVYAGPRLLLTLYIAQDGSYTQQYPKVSPVGQ